MTVENLRNFLETTTKSGFFGPEKVHDDAKERGKEEEERERGGFSSSRLLLLATLEIRNPPSKRHDLSWPVFKNPG